MNLSSDQSRWLVESPDFDMTVNQGRSLLKASQVKTGQRKRTTSNVFTTMRGRAQPRSGFLSVEILRAIYERSELVRACVDTLIEFVSSADWEIKPVDPDHSKWLKKRRPEEYLEQRRRIRWLTEFFKQPNPLENLDLFHRKLLRDLLIYDAGAYELVTADYPGSGLLPLELGVVAGETVEIETDDRGIPVNYWQSYNVVRNVEFGMNELAYLMLNPCSWKPYGISPIETAYVSIAADLSGNKYNADVFAKNNIPPALLAVLGVSQAEFRSIMSQLRTTSSDNPHNIHAFRAQRNPDGNAQKVFDMVPLNQLSNKDMQYQELLQLCVNRVCMMYKVSPSQIGFTEQVTGGIGSGVAETQENLQQNKGVAPLLRVLERSHTSTVIHGCCGWGDLEFGFTQSNTPQEQAEYSRDGQEVQMGISTINEFRSKWGGRKAVPWGDMPSAPPPGYQPPASPQQLQQQAMGMGGAPPQPDQGGGQQAAPPQPFGQPQDLQKSTTKRIIINF